MIFNRYMCAISALLICNSPLVLAEESWIGIEYGILNISSAGTSSGSTNTPVGAASGSTPVLRFTGEVCSATLGTEGEITQIYGNFGVTANSATSVLGIDCGLSFWDKEFAVVDVDVKGGFRYRYHSHFTMIQDTYTSLPLSIMLSKEIGGGIKPYTTIGFSPVGYLAKDKYGKYNSFEVGLWWQFADDWKASVSYTKTHDEAVKKNSSPAVIYKYDSTMTVAGIHLYW